MKSKLTQDQINFIIDNYPIYGTKFCAEQLKLPKTTINNVRHKFKLKCLNVNDILKRSHYKPNNKFKVNADGFINVQTPEHAYLLGFIWADGSILSGLYKTTIHIVKEDYEQIKNIFAATGNWNVYFRKHKKWKEQATIETSNKPLRDYLFSMDYASKSASPDKILQTIPDDLKKYWYLGLFDGDGCLSIFQNKYARASISSCYEQDWSFLEKIFTKMNLKFKIKRTTSNKGHKSSAIILSNKYSCNSFLSYLYENNKSIKLIRKFNMFLELKKILNIPVRIKNKYTGVCKVRNKFRCSILLNGIKKHLGYFESENIAAMAYNKFIIDNQLNKKLNIID